MGAVPGDQESEKIPVGLPERWATLARGPMTYDLPRGWRDIMARYYQMGQAPSLREIFNVTVGKQNPTQAQLESGYIDEDFRDEYIAHYAKTYRDIPRRCERLHFYDDSDASRKDYLGYIVMRPIIGRPVCRTMLRTPAKLAPHVSCVARYSTHPWGYRLNVEGFPFISQDSQLGSCAHAAIWMIALYFHLRYGRPRYHMSDIARSARDHHDWQPNVPSKGLTTRQISAALADLDMTPVIYRLDSSMPDTPAAIVHRHLNSGLPVMLLLDDEDVGLHAKVLIGYGRDEDGLFYVNHDDQRGPYLRVRQLPELSDDRLQHLVVPMPGKIFLSGEAAVAYAGLIFDEMIERDPRKLSWLAGGIDDGRLRLCSYITEVATYKRNLRRRVHEDVARWHLGFSTSHWLWVVELQLQEAAVNGPACVLGEIVLDATSDDEWVNALFGNLPGLTMHWPALGEHTEILASGQGRKPYLSGSALHVADDSR